MTPPTGGPAGLSGLREALQSAVEASSLRQVADEVGMSFNGLRTFITGGRRRPQAATIRKVAAWYERTHGATIERRLVKALLQLSATERRQLPPQVRELVDELRRGSAIRR